MADDLVVTITDEDRAIARTEVEQTSRGTTVGGITVVIVATFGASMLGQVLFPGLTGFPRAAVTATTAGVLIFPLLFAVASLAKRRGTEAGAGVAAQQRVMRIEARRREFESRLIRALEMSDDEGAACDVVGRAMHAVIPETPVELLLADNSHAHLEQVVASSSNGVVSGCAVESPDCCIAARRGGTQVFADSDAIDACPMLRDREQGRCSAVCLPVSIMGRAIGVIHATAAVDEQLDEEAVSALQTVADQAGNRLGMLRVMAETQLQASTDGLTGLVNRRSLENRMHQLRADDDDFAFVMADLDQFKALNDAHGHDTGDRALRVFSEVLRTELRSEDTACRYGGEEFAIVLPGIDLDDAVDVCTRIRAALALTAGRGDTPTFTASVGISHSSEADTLEDLVQRADRAMFAAKATGRDSICLDGRATPVTRKLTALP